MNPKIGFIGGGNMAQAIIAGLLQSGRSAEDIIVSDPNIDCHQNLQSQGVRCFDMSTPVMEQTNVIVIAVKPQVIKKVLAGLSEQLRAQQIIVSIAAGITLKTIRRNLNDSLNPMVRVMPNTPALIGKGMSALVSDAELPESDRQTVQSIFESCGRAVWVPTEDTLDAVTAVSGSGPAYFFLLIENLINTGVRLGLAHEVARQLVIQTAVGAAGMVESSDVGPDILRERVTSPGGTTQAALSVFNEQDFANIVDVALTAARDRAGELSKDGA